MIDDDDGWPKSQDTDSVMLALGGSSLDEIVKPGTASSPTNGHGKCLFFRAP
jgi:hypothetical protein